MGYIRICAGPFVAGTKMESKNQRCRKLTGSKNPEQYPTKEQQKACLERYGLNPTFTYAPSAVTKIQLSYEYFTTNARPIG